MRPVSLATMLCVRDLADALAFCCDLLGFSRWRCFAHDPDGDLVEIEDAAAELLPA